MNSNSTVTGKSHLHRNQPFSLMDHDCLNVMYKDKLLCDVVLIAEGLEVPAHKLILASSSAFFYWKFSKNRHLPMLNRIEIPNLTYETLSAVVRYLYECEILITERNVGDLSAAAFLFSLKDLQRACRGFLETNLNIKNCLKTKRIATQCQYEELAVITHDNMVDQFSLFVKQDEFLEMDYEQMADLISADSLCISDEEEVLDCVIKWVNNDLQHRKCHIHNLLNNVRFSFISQSKILERLDHEEWLKSDPQYGLILQKVIKCHNTDSFHGLTQRSSKCLLAVGATDANVLDVELYNFEKKLWLRLPGLSGITFSDSTRATVLGMRICHIDGQSLKFFSIGDPARTEQLRYSELLNDRTYFNVATHNDLIYILGGFCGTSILSCVERLDISTGECKAMARMLEARLNVGAGVFQGNVYVFGGTNGGPTCWNFMNSVECYHSDSDTWYAMPNMSIKRSRTGVTNLGDSLYIVGGWNGFVALKQVEVFNPVQLYWKRLADMNVSRSDPGLIAVNGQLFVFGGYDGKVCLQSAEVYDSKSNTWTMLPSSMNTGKRYVSVGLVQKAHMKLCETLK